MNADSNLPDLFINRSAIGDLALDDRISRSELRLLLYFIANSELFIHSLMVEDDFHLTNLPFLQQGTAACFMISSTREDLRRTFGFATANPVSNILSKLVETGYIRRYQNIGMRTLFSFMVKPTFFTLDRSD